MFREALMHGVQSHPQYSTKGNMLDKDENKNNKERSFHLFSLLFGAALIIGLFRLDDSLA
jgi:hypothetical protein